MRVVVDAMCAQFGGIATYTERLLEAWPHEYPGDELHVLLPERSDWWPLRREVVRHDAAVRRPAVVGRPASQTIHVPALAREVDADAVLATLPSTSLRGVGRALVVVVYDLRHELRPDQFTFARRTMRNLSYGRGYRLADVIISISRRSLDDLRRLHPDLDPRRHRMVHFGSDHIDSWARGEPNGAAIAFGHHSNKNVDLVLDAWQLMASGNAAQSPPRLILLGLGRDGRERVAGEIGARGLEDVVELAPFLPQPDFERVLTGASMVVFPTDFEGFGLPVVEALRLRIPVVIGPESACLEVSGGHATVMDGWTAAALADAVRRAAATPAAQLDAGARHTDAMTWSAAVHGTRAALLDAVAIRASRTDA